MQHTYFLTRIIMVLLTGFSAAAFGQTWPQPGAEWTYCVGYYMGDYQSTMAHTGDTTINGQAYQVTERTDNNSQEKLFTRFSNDTIYRWVNDQEYLFFTYDLEVGDVYTTYRSAGVTDNWGDSSCTSVMPLKVTDKQWVEYNGTELQQWTLKDTLYSHLYGGNVGDSTYVFTERIGGTDGYPLISYTETAGECGIPFFELTYSLGSYEDDNFYYHVEDCPGVGIDETAREVPVSVSPNPATDVLHVEMEAAPESPANLTIYNMSGKPVKQVSLQQKYTTVIISELPPGIYLLKYNSLNKNSSLFTETIIKE